MKKVELLLILSFFYSCKSKTTYANSETPKSVERYEMVSKSAIETEKYNRATDLGTRLLDACNTSKFKAFSNSEATDKVRQNATQEKISMVCRKINSRNGKYLGVTLLDITKDNTTEDLVFRYDIKYQKNYFQRELKVTVNSANKVSSITTKEVPRKQL
ncbi:MAG: 5'-3' exonuclease [Flavobacterium sp.]|jgi:5'-3' exonuclease